MSGRAARVVVSEQQQQVLKKSSPRNVRPSGLPRGLALFCWRSTGCQIRRSRHSFRWDANRSGCGRRRWKHSFDALVSVECGESTAQLVRTIEDVLSDAPRSGCRGKFTGEQVVQILAIACEAPELSGQPVSDWTARELAEEVLQREYVESISVSTMGRLLKSARLQLHRGKYWLNTREKDRDRFDEQVRHVCRIWQDAERLFHEENAHVVSVDEMPGLQALERIAKTIPMSPGRPQRIEFEYKRHGTLCLIGNWHVTRGQMISPTIQETRTEEDLLWHFHRAVQTDADADWVFVMDQLNVHCSASLVCWIARLEGIDPESLGKKGRSGVLKSMASRQEFLSDTNHRVRFVFLPKHSSWLNQIEIFFGIVNRRVMRHSGFPSLAELRQRLTKFIDYFNETFARPIDWKYTGQHSLRSAGKRSASGITISDNSGRRIHFLRASSSFTVWSPHHARCEPWADWRSRSTDVRLVLRKGGHHERRSEAACYTVAEA